MTAFYQVEDLIVYSALDCTEYRRKQPKMCHKIELSYPLSSRPLLRLPCVCRGAWPKAKEGAATSVCCLFSISLHWGGKTSDRRTQVCGKFITIKVLPFFFCRRISALGRGPASVYAKYLHAVYTFIANISFASSRSIPGFFSFLFFA